MFQRQQVMAGGDAGAAHHGDVFDRALTDQRTESFREFCRNAKTTVAEQVVCVWAIDRTRDMAGRLVQWLALATKAFAATRIDQTQRAIATQIT